VANKSAGALSPGRKSRLTKADREGIRRGVRQGIKDLEEGRYEEYDEHGLRNLAKKLVATSVKKLPHSRKPNEVSLKSLSKTNRHPRPLR
jgi:hypothetical protein